MNESVIQKNSNKNKPNKVPYILNRKINTLVNAKRIEDAENHIINLHREYDGKLAIAITSNEDTFRTWNQYSFSIEELLEVVWKFLAEKDVYISANGFWNNRRRLADLRHLKAFVIDLDYYKIEKYAKKTQEEMYSILLKKEKKFFSGKLTKRKYYAMMCLTIKNVSAGGKRRNGEKQEGGTFV